MDFQTARGHVQDLLLDLPSTTAGLVDAFINKAIRDAEEQAYSFRHMEASATFTTTEGTRALGARPARWKKSRGAPYHLRDDGTTDQIQWASSLSEMIRQYPDSTAPATDRGEPQFLLEDGENTEFHCYPVPDGGSDYSDGDYRIVVPYWRFTAELVTGVDDANTNWWLTNAPWYVIFQAVGEGLITSLSEDRAAVYLGKARSEYAKARKLDGRGKVADGASLAVRTSVYARARAPRRI